MWQQEHSGMTACARWLFLVVVLVEQREGFLESHH
jgi:hypothetical protein